MAKTQVITFLLSTAQKIYFAIIFKEQLSKW